MSSSLRPYKHKLAGNALLISAIAISLAACSTQQKSTSAQMAEPSSSTVRQSSSAPVASPMPQAEMASSAKIASADALGNEVMTSPIVVADAESRDNY